MMPNKAARKILADEYSEMVWDMSEDWRRAHYLRDDEGETLPDYVKGVYAGLCMAARELGKRGS